CSLARLLPSDVRLRIRSRSTFGKSAEYRQHQPPSAGAGVGPRFRQGAKLRLGVRDALDDAKQVEGAARLPVDARHSHHVAGGEAVDHPKKLAPVGPRACHLLAVEMPTAASRRPQLLKLAVEGLPVGADAGIADKTFFGMSFGHIFCQP